MRLIPRLTWAQPGGLLECPYFYRWVLDFGLFAIRLHKWVRSDDDRAYHDHPYWFATLVLWGGYVDVCPGFDGLVGEDVLTAGSVRFRPADYRHTVQVTRSPTWTLLLTGPAGRRWSFFVGERRVMRDKYFATRGHHPCSPTEEPVRMRPDGSRIKP